MSTVLGRQAGGSREEAAYVLEAVIARLLVIGTWTAMALVLVGVILMFVSGVDPMAHGPIPPFDPGQIVPQMLALEPLGFLWAGITLIIALPIGRVIVAGIGFLAARDPRMALVSLAVFLVVIASIAAALGLEG